MSEEHWDISEKDAEFFAKLMGVSRPSDARPWHAQFPDVAWLVTQSTDTVPPELNSTAFFPDLDLLETSVNESPPEILPPPAETEGVDLDWLAFQRTAESPGAEPEVGEGQNAGAEPGGNASVEVPDITELVGEESEEEEALRRALGEMLAGLTGGVELASEEAVQAQESAETPEDAQFKPGGEDEAVLFEPPEQEEGADLIGVAEVPGGASEEAEDLAEEIPDAAAGASSGTSELPGVEVENEPPREEEFDFGDLIGAEEVRELGEDGVPVQESGVSTEQAASESGEGQPEAAAETGRQKSALVPDEWTEFQLEEKGHPGSEAVQAELETAEPESPPEDRDEAEEVIGATELNERAAVPWANGVEGQASPEKDTFVELAVEQRIRRPGLFQRLALVDTDRRVGIEIGKHQVIYTVVVRRGSRFELEGYGIVPVETSDGEDEAVERASLQKVLEEIFSDRTLRQASVAVADDEMETIIRRLELPRLSKKEMAEALRWALRKELPFDPDAAQIAHTYLTEKAAKNSRKIPVLAVAASKPEVEATVQRLRLSGVKMASLVAPSWALYRLFTRFEASDPETCQVLVHIGALRSEILFVQDGDLLFQRTITTALDDFVNALTSTLFEEGGRASLSRREAFALLRKYGIPEMGAKGRTDTGLRLTEVAVSVRPVVEKLINEVERSLDYFRQKFKTRQFGRLWLSGIGATVLNLGGVLEGETRVPTQVFRPSSDWPAFHVCKGLPEEVLEKHGPALVIPLGLATQKREPLNLLPPKYRHSSLVRLAQRGVAYGTLMGVIAAGMVTANLAYKTQVVRSDIVLLEQQHLRLVKQQAQLRKLQNDRNALRRELNAYVQALPKGEGVSIYLKALSRLTPPSIALTSVELVPPEETAKNPNVGATEGAPTAVLRIQGIVFPDPPREGAHLAQFLLGLKQSGLFRTVRLENSRESDLPRVGLEFLAVGELR
ncbi:MAG: type IV pilus assembly protein PilM [Calditrichaeota bacterium]|nr:type IV pilus assembly protein PilM [Calditrichota bacterium]